MTDQFDDEIWATTCWDEEAEETLDDPWGDVWEAENSQPEWI